MPPRRPVKRGAREPYNAAVSPRAGPPHALPPSFRLQEAVVTALRGNAPAANDDSEADIEAALRRYECGGWLHARWRSGAVAGIPDTWRAAAARAHRRTLLDTLAALGGLREVASLLAEAGTPFVLIKGVAYLADLYTDAGARAFTDVDLLVPGDYVAPLARRLAAAGFAGAAGPEFPEDCRFEMYRPGPAACRFEIHWRLGSGGRMRLDQEALWQRARAATVEGVPCRLLAPDDALLFHVGHAADHYFGPTLKWALDLREMLRLWNPDPPDLVEQARAAGLMTALHLALGQVETLFPGATPPALLRATALGPARRAAIGWARGRGPAEFLRVSGEDRRRMALRPFLFDSFIDAARVTATVLRRPAARWRRSAGGAPMPWEPERPETPIDPRDPRVVR